MPACVRACGLRAACVRAVCVRAVCLHAATRATHLRVPLTFTPPSNELLQNQLGTLMARFHAVHALTFMYAHSSL